MCATVTCDCSADPAAAARALDRRAAMLARAGNLLSINATTLMRAFDKKGNRNSNSGTKRGAKTGQTRLEKCYIYY